MTDRDHEDVVIWRLDQLERRWDDFERKLDEHFKRDTAEHAALSLRVDRLEQRASLASKVIGALCAALLAVVVNAVRVAL